MTLPELALRRPVLAIVANILLVIVGAAALMQLPIRELPDVDTAQVTVSVNYEGAAPEVVDAEVTNPIEDAIASIAGVRSISSESERGSNRTVIEFESDRDIDVAANDVRAAVARVRGELPGAADEPVVEKSDTETEPVIRLTLTSDELDGAALTDFADRYINDQISRLPGVASVQISGERTYAMRVWLDRRAMASRGVTVSDIVEALEDNNVELPAGRIDTPLRQFQIRTDTRFTEAQAFEEITLRRGDGGTPIRLGDVADVVRGVENDDSLYRANFESAVGLGVLRQSQANTVAISEAVRGELSRIRDGLPDGMRLEIASDDAVFINNSIRQVLITLAIAVALVVAVIFAFLASARATLVPALTIPIALVGAGAGLWAFGFSINILTLFALILAIGLVVDDAIVVLENIQRRIDDGEDVLAASARGASQVGFAVIATTLTLIAVFVPISFLQGQVGQLFSEFGVVLAIAVAVSTFVALTLVPVLAARILSPNSEAGGYARYIGGALGRLAGGYRRSLTGALKVPWLVLGLAAMVAAAAAAAYPRVPSELTPSEDRGVFFINISAPQGVNLAYTNDVVREVEAVLKPLRDDGPVEDVIAIVGRWGELRRAFLVATLVPWEEREVSTAEVVEDLRPALEAINRANIRVGTPAGLGLRGGGSPLEFWVGGSDFDEVADAADVMAAALDAEEGITDVELEWSPNQPGFVVSVARDRARSLGIEARAISEALQALFASTDATEYIDRGRQYPVVVQARDADRAGPADLTGVYLRSEGGELVPLDGLVEVATVATPRALNRYSRLPAIEVSASLERRYGPWACHRADPARSRTRSCRPAHGSASPDRRASISTPPAVSS